MAELRVTETEEISKFKKHMFPKICSRGVIFLPMLWFCSRKNQVIKILCSFSPVGRDIEIIVKLGRTQQLELDWGFECKLCIRDSRRSWDSEHFDHN